MFPFFFQKPLETSCTDIKKWIKVSDPYKDWKHPTRQGAFILALCKDISKMSVESIFNASLEMSYILFSKHLFF